MLTLSALDTVWTLLGATLVFFMQAGFTMVEAGFTRAKNAGNIIMKNLMDFCLGTLVFWVIGFGLMHGTSVMGVIGIPDFFVQGDYSSNIPSNVFLIFQTVFCATAATIVSGAMAERTKFSAYCLYSILLSAFIYPISGHWIWGGGWLSQMGFHDFAGSTAVHMVGGVAALVGAKILGPRIGKYTSDGKSKAILGHNLVLGALGVFILWFCWFGFNGGSTVSATGDDVLISLGNIFVTTNMAAAAAATGTMCITWIKYKKPDVSMTLNGALGGLVAVTAGCDVVSPLGALVIGFIASLVIVYGIEFIDKTLKIDDPVGAIGVHGMCGAFGTIATGFLSVEEGLLYGHGAAFLSVQAIGVAAVIAWVAGTMTVIFLAIRATIGLRVSQSEEIAGLDLEEHGLLSSYADFVPVPIQPEPEAVFDASFSAESTDSSMQAAAYSEENSEDDKMTKVSLVINQNRFEQLKEALTAIGVTGMTVTQVLGYGMQKGHKKYYRGSEVDSTLLPKVKVEVVVCKTPVSQVIETAKSVLCTGQIGDGKIFVYDVENVVKVRTGEEGYSALQDEWA